MTLPDLIEPPTLIVSPTGDYEVVHEIGQMPLLRRRSDSKTIAVLDRFGTPNVDRIVFSPDGVWLLIASNVSGQDENGRPKSGYAVLETATGRKIFGRRQQVDNISRIQFSPDGTYLLADAKGGADYGFDGVDTSANLIEANSGKLVSDLTSSFGRGLTDTPRGGYADTEFSADGKLLYGVRYSGIVDVWNIDPNKRFP